MFDVSKSIVEEIKIDSFSERGIRLLVKRDDLIHPVVSGNKWRKLKYNVELCIARKKQGLLTFGGAYSNHLIATAAACQKVGLKSIGIVRGDELDKNSNETLMRCSDFGMELIFVSRSEYSLRHEKAFIEATSIKYPNYHIVPEGGANYHGMIGCQEIVREVQEKVDHIFVAQGTSTTSCGIALSLNNTQKLHVSPALKGYDSISEMRTLYLSGGIDNEMIDMLLDKVIVHSEFHFGGYGKYTKELIEFIQEFYKKYGLKLDPVYTAKLMYSLLAVVQDLSFDNTTILFIHTGGIQGAKGVEKKIGKKLFRD